MIKGVIIISTTMLALYASGLLCEVPRLNLAGVDYGRLWDNILECYGVPFAQFCITSFYSIYMQLTLVNALVFSMKYIPIGLYLHTFVKSVYLSSRERLKSKQMELEDIVLQIAIVETKQSMREAACAEYLAQLQRESARLRAAREWVRDLIAGEASLRAVLERLGRTADLDQHTADDTHLKSSTTVELLKYLAHDKNGLIDNLNNVSEYGQRQFESVSENSEYSSLSDAGEDCRVKIIRVTNVYRMAYLKQYIKQRRLRRANKHIMLKKKMESTKKLLESWQKSLNIALCSLEVRDETSEEAMGDYSKRRESDTDSDLRDSYDEYPVWDQPAPSGDYFQEPESSESLEDFASQDYNDKYCGNIYEGLESSTLREELESHNEPVPCECAELQPMPSLVEETISQMLAIQEINTLDHNDSSDLVIAL